MALRLEPGARLVVATHNPGKARELAEILENRFQLVTAGELGLAEPEETESTFVGNALLKARARWLMPSLVRGSISPKVRSRPSGRKIGS